MDWSQITSSQFEEIACLYARDTYKDFKWMPTKKTRDGNRDGEFEEEIDTLNILYKGWYEAKYTKNSEQSIPKAHMDSTLVSGILDGYVAAIIFITNGKITRVFQRRAKAILTPFKIQVWFVEGIILENWLLANNEIYCRYFGEIQGSLVAEVTKVSIDDVCFFDGIMTPSALAAPLQKLQQGEEYYIYISVRSNVFISAKISWNLSELGYIPSKKNKQRFSLVPGFNSFLIKVYANDIYSGKMIIKISSDDKLLDKYALSKLIIENENILNLVYSNQMYIIQNIYNFKMEAKYPNVILTITGKSGYGKSYLLRKIAANLIDYHVNFLSIEFSDKPAENASLFCKLILFLNFGLLFDLSDDAFLELIKDTINLPLDIYLQLKEGTSNQLTALSVVDRLDKLLKKTEYSLIANKDILDKTISYIILDDVQKVQDLFARLLINIFDDFHNKLSGQCMLLGYRPNEFAVSDLEKNILHYKSESWTLKNVTYSDVKLSIEKNISKSAAELIDLFPMPINILHLYLFIRKLIQKNIDDLPFEKKVNCFQKIYKETNVQNSKYVINKIKTCLYPEILFLIYKIETGIPISYLIEYYGDKGDQAICYLENEQLVKNTDGILSPFHDTYLYAFGSIEYLNNTYIDELDKFLQFCIKRKDKEPILISNIISIITLEAENANYTYRNTILKLCNKYFFESKYNASKKLAEALLPMLDSMAPADFSNKDLWPLFIYAQSIKFSESHFASDKYLQLLCDIGETQVISYKNRNIIYEAHSELLSNAIWELNKEESKKQIDFLTNVLVIPPDNQCCSNYKNAFLILLNRKLLYNAFFENIDTSDNLFKNAIDKSKFYEQEDYEGYALMDHAKNNIVIDPLDSISKLEQSLTIFEKYTHCRKRFLDCKSEIIFLKAIYKRLSFDELYDIQHCAFVEKFGHVYAKITLKIIALEIMTGYNIKNVNKKLDNLILQYPDICSKYRLHLFFFMLKAAISYSSQDKDSLQKWNTKYFNMSKSLSANYYCVAEHNLNLLQPKYIKWYCGKSSDLQALWLDPRIW